MKFNPKPKNSIRSEMIRHLWRAKFAEAFPDNSGKDQYAYLTKALREINAEPVFYQKDNAFLLILLEKQKATVLLKREWGLMGATSQKAVERFESMVDAREKRNLIVRHKLRSGYKPVF